MQLACCLLSFQFWVVQVAYLEEWCQWGDCKIIIRITSLQKSKICYRSVISGPWVMQNVFVCRLLVLSIFITVAYMMTWSFIPRFLKLMIQLSSQVSWTGLFLLCSDTDFDSYVHCFFKLVMGFFLHLVLGNIIHPTWLLCSSFLVKMLYYHHSKIGAPCFSFVSLWYFCVTTIAVSSKTSGPCPCRLLWTI